MTRILQTRHVGLDERGLWDRGEPGRGKRCGERRGVRDRAASEQSDAASVVTISAAESGAASGGGSTDGSSAGVGGVRRLRCRVTFSSLRRAASVAAAVVG